MHSHQVQLTPLQICVNTDTSMPSGMPQAHFCVQWSIDSRNFAIHNDYCTLLHPSSTCEPRHLLLKLFMHFVETLAALRPITRNMHHDYCTAKHSSRLSTGQHQCASQASLMLCDHTNDPSAGSPTETLLRLLLPLSNKVYKLCESAAQMQEHGKHPDYSPDHSIGRSDGRCVQRAGT